MANVKCWFWNIDKGTRPYFSSQLENGRLRQGWGYHDDLDLRKLKKKDKKENETIAWNRVFLMLEEIKKGDIVVVKNIPDNQSFTLVRVTGEYDFNLDKNVGDYGHYLPVEKIRVFNKYSQIVPISLIRALDREAHPIRITYKHASTVMDLAIKEIIDIKDATTPQKFKDKMVKIRAALCKTLKENLLTKETKLSPDEARKLILAMLKNDGFETESKHGPREYGADLLSTVNEQYGLDIRFGVQVKFHEGTDNDTEGVDQIQLAFHKHKIQAGLLVTFADELGPKLEEKIKIAKQEHQFETFYGDELYSRLLEVIASFSFENEDIQ